MSRKGERTFHNVAVGIPTKVSSSEAEEEWQEVNWAMWATGDLAVDPSTLLLVFKLQTGGAKMGKQLGEIRRAQAEAVPGTDGGKIVHAYTSDPITQHYRFTFATSGDASEFLQFSKVAEAQHTTAMGGGGVEIVGLSADMIKLEANIHTALVDRLPLVFSGVELWGPDPSGAGSGEVLLAEGACALVDPPAQRRSMDTKSYDLLFYSKDDGVRGAAKKFTIGPHMALKERTYDGEDVCGYGTTFEIPSVVQGMHGIRFACANAASSFARDYRVRQRLMEVSSSTAKGLRAVNGLNSEIECMKQRGLLVRTANFFKVLIILLLVGALIRIAFLNAEDKRRPLKTYFEVLLHDFLSISRLSQDFAMSTTAKACKIAVGAVPSADVLLCTELDRGSDVKRCIEQLVT